jgi:polyferredoxin
MECDGLVFHEPGDCPVCGMHLQKQEGLQADVEAGGFFDSESLLEGAEAAEPAEPKRALMPGVDNAYFYVGAGAVALLSLLLFGFLGEPRRNMKKTSKRWEYPRFELTRFGPLKRFVKWRGFQYVLQGPVVALFALVLFAGLFGNQDAGRNIAPVLTWNIWWMGLIFFAFFAGEIWCTVCPWMAVPDWLSKIVAKFRSGKVRRYQVGLQRKWPQALRNLYPAIGAFMLVTWLELAYEAPYQPALTATMGLGMLLFAGVTLFVFERKGFCRYLCPVGRVTGAYGTTGLLEIRRRDSDVCRQCQTNDCLHGNENGLPCPTWEFMGAMNENTYCTMCAECLKTCPHDNIGLNVRAPFADLAGPHRKRLDEAWFLLAIFGISVFHGFAMIPAWTHDIVPPAREWIVATTGVDPGWLATFTAGMAIFLAALVGVYTAACRASQAMSGNLAYRLKDYFITFSYTALPVALTYHLAHNALHFFWEGSKLRRLASDPFGWGWDLFGTANAPLTMLLPMDVLWAIQIALVVAGQCVAVWLARRATYRMFGNRRQALRALIPIVVFLTLASIACLWLLNQPMEMRTA